MLQHRRSREREDRMATNRMRKRTKDQGPRTRCEQRLNSRSVAREARIAGLPLALAFGVSLPALAQKTCLGIGGVGRYEVVVIGDELAREDADFNMAYEVTDNGLVVGQVAVLDQRPAGPTRVNRAFLYLTQPLFGFPAGQALLLPSIGTGGAVIPAIARDVNASGWIVGDVGAPDAISFLSLRDATAWRLTGAGGIEVLPVEPPATAPDLGTYGWLTSVSDGATPWAAFTFEGAYCSFGPVQIPTESVAAVRLAPPPGQPGFRSICGPCPEPDVVAPPGSAFVSGRTLATGMSPNGGRMCGSREDCGYQLFCGEPFNTRARQWYAASLCEGSGNSNDCLACITCITPDPDTEVRDSAARQYSVLDDGVAAGFVADGWLGLEHGADECGPRSRC
jgi:hypothetical protein